MQKVTILGLHNSMATTVCGPMDILNQAGRLWNRICGTPQTPFFDVSVVSVDGQPFRCANNLLIQPNSGIAAVAETDLLLIASATYIDRILDASPELIPWIRRLYNRGSHVASICTGVFLLAETGLLDGKTATLHWGYVELFRQRYPGVEVRPERMFIDHGNLSCSAGIHAGMDLSLYLVEKFCGRQVAVQCAKTMVLDPGRETQTPYARLLTFREHDDPVVAKAQAWVEEHHTRPLDYDRLAAACRSSRRSLERRFKNAIGITPLEYQQRLRVETARRLLEEGGRSFQEITWQVGYEDISFFRRLFHRLTGLRPREYRRRFATGAIEPPLRSTG